MASDPPSTVQGAALTTNEALVRQFRLRVVAGPAKGRAHASQGPKVVIGRHQSADLVLDDPSVSRFHCEIAVVDGKAVVTDLGSRSGTIVNGVSVVSAYLRDGIRIQLGDCELTFDLETRHVRIPLSERSRFGGLVGRSAAMRAVFASLESAAKSDATVLILGETGTGKELAAEALHAESARRNGPFVVVDCGGLVPNLLESELFGHERGAFTGADRARAGAFENARGGTLFLDEIGELPLDLQAVLLGALERRVIRRVGGSTSIPIDVRVVAATNRNLWTEVNSQRFRSDLYYRLAVLVVTIPPLRDRADDLPLLVEDILSRGGPEPAPDHLRSQAVLAELANHRWSGNVRELRNYIERSRHGDVMLLTQTDDALQPLTVDTQTPFTQGREQWIREFERRYLRALLVEHDHNVSAAARAVDLDRSTLYRMLFRCGLAQPRRSSE